MSEIAQPVNNSSYTALNLLNSLVTVRQIFLLFLNQLSIDTINLNILYCVETTRVLVIAMLESTRDRCFGCSLQSSEAEITSVISEMEDVWNSHNPSRRRAVWPCSATRGKRYYQERNAHSG